MMDKKASALTLFSLSLLFFMVFLVQPLNMANANFISGTTPNPPPPPFPAIVIGSDGNVNPQNAPINRTGNVYTLTGDIINCSLSIECNNVTVDGSGFTLKADPALWDHYSPAAGVAIRASQVTIRNMNINQFSMLFGGICVFNPNNTIAGNNITAVVNLASDCNNVTGNTLRGYELRLRGSTNLHYPSLDVYSSSFNTIVGNTLESYGVHLSVGHNIFYLNNFVNSTNANSKDTNAYIDPLWWQLMLNGKPIPEIEWTPQATWMPLYQSDSAFDSGSVGNYWSDYNGTDANHDGIGDTPYLIGGELKDYHPLMSPVNISKATLPLTEWTPPSPAPKPSPTLSPAPPPTPSNSPSPSASNTTIQQQPALPAPQPMSFPTELLYVTAATAAIVIIPAAVILRKRK